MILKKKYYKWILTVQIEYQNVGVIEEKWHKSIISLNTHTIEIYGENASLKWKISSMCLCVTHQKCARKEAVMGEFCWQPYIKTQIN